MSAVPTPAAQQTAQSLFDVAGNSVVSIDGAPGEFTVEELYQAFKTRLMADLLVDVHGTTHYGRLIAAGPELLQMLARLVARYKYDGIPNDTLRDVEAAEVLLDRLQGLQS